MYILVNRENRVVDIMIYAGYTKLHPQSARVIGCEEREATGVIGSDCNSIYTLIKADTQNKIDAVNVYELESIPSEVVAGYYYYDPSTGEFSCNLEEAQYAKQEENKIAFASYLASHPLTWVDGKQYGVTQEDQSEIALNINQYQVALAAGVENPTLEWHAKQEECYPWSLEQLSALSLAIAEVVYPKYHQMQEYKTAIFATTSIAELNAIALNYEYTTDIEEDN